jgi:hypothetical protein
VYRVDSNDVGGPASDVEWACGELVDLPPVALLGLVAELRVAVDEVRAAALTAGMTAAQRLGWGLHQIANHTGVSHEQVRRLLAAASPGSPGRR